MFKIALSVVTRLAKNGFMGEILSQAILRATIKEEPRKELVGDKWLIVDLPFEVIEKKVGKYIWKGEIVPSEVKKL